MISLERQALALALSTRAALQAAPGARPSGSDLALLADALHTAAHNLPVGGAFRALCHASLSVGDCSRRETGPGSRRQLTQAIADLDTSISRLVGAS